MFALWKARVSIQMDLCIGKSTCSDCTRLGTKGYVLIRNLNDQAHGFYCDLTLGIKPRYFENEADFTFMAIW